jgi:hypothetical protein
MFFFFVTVVCASAATTIDTVNSLYCCQYGGAQQFQCAVGGCQRGNVSAFWVVDNCANCSAVPTGARVNAVENVTTSCTYCAASNRSDCADSVSTDRGLRCVAPNATLSALQRFRVVDSVATSEPPLLCCWFDDGALASNGTGSCSAANASVSAFVEWLDVDQQQPLLCPARPPCDKDCNGHGHCAVTQCACDTNFFGDTCGVRCDRRLCVMGRCVNDANGSRVMCQCDENVVGDRCNTCAPGFSGTKCSIATSSSTSSSTTSSTSTSTSTSSNAQQVTDSRHVHYGDNGALDTVSIVALSIGGLVMIGLVSLTFKRCIVWVIEQRRADNSYRPLTELER